jgi:stage III sporulation protein AF
MISFLKDWVLNIAALVMFIVIVEMLMPSGRMKKYASLVTGFVLIIAIINPLLKLIGGGVKFEDIQITSSNYMDKLEIEKNSSLLEEEQNKQIIEIYRKKLIKQLEDKLSKTEGITEVKGDVIINEDLNSDSFGEIIRAYAEVTVDEGGDDIKPVTKIKKVVIGDNENTNTGKKEIDSALKKRLESKIKDLFGIDNERIVITETTG